MDSRHSDLLVEANLTMEAPDTYLEYMINLSESSEIHKRQNISQK